MRLKIILKFQHLLIKNNKYTSGDSSLVLYLKTLSLLKRYRRFILFIKKITHLIFNKITVLLLFSYLYFVFFWSTVITFNNKHKISTFTQKILIWINFIFFSLENILKTLSVFKMLQTYHAIYLQNIHIWASVN